MHEIYELKDMLCEELEKYGSKTDLKAGELEIVDKLAHAVKNLGKIIEMAEEEEYSNEGGMMGGSYAYARGGNRGGGRGSYARDGGSYARGRGSNARRDSRGRYSRERGYSRAADEMVEQLRDLMEDAPNETIRRDIERLATKVEQQM